MAFLSKLSNLNNPDNSDADNTNADNGDLNVLQYYKKNHANMTMTMTN